MSCSLSRLYLSFLLLLTTSASWAIPVKWELKDVIFNDGVTATGSFYYDADTDTFSGISITVAGFATAGVYGSLDDDPFTYMDQDFVGGGNSQLLLYRWDTTTTAPDDCAQTFCRRSLDFNIDGNLTNAGGEHNLIYGIVTPEYVENDFLEVAESHYIVGGSVASVPVPAAAWLFGSALGLLGWLRRK